MFSQYTGAGHEEGTYVQDQKRTQEVGDRARSVITLRLSYSNMTQQFKPPAHVSGLVYWPHKFN